MPARTKIVVQLTPKEAEALWTAANNGRNDFLCDPVTAKIYFRSPRGIGNANRAIDKLAKASRGKITLQPLPCSLTRYQQMEIAFTDESSWQNHGTVNTLLATVNTSTVLASKSNDTSSPHVKRY